MSCTLLQARHAEELGVDAISAVAPSIFKTTSVGLCSLNSHTIYTPYHVVYVIATVVFGPVFLGVYIFS